MKNLLCVLVVGFALCAVVFAQPELDSTFGTGGKSVIVSNFLGGPVDMAIQPDNKIILVSNCRTIDGGVPFCLARMNQDGTPDNTFRGGSSSSFGGVFTSFTPLGSGAAWGVALQSDGKVIAVGSGPGTGSGQDAALIRYNPDGALDPSFGTGGIVLTAVSGADDSAQKIALQPDGKIVIAGTTGSTQFVARYLSNGTLDSSFGTGGIAQSAIFGTAGNSIALQPDGKIVVGGSSGSGYLLARFNSDGSPDTSWDGDGILIVAAAENVGLGIRSLGIQLDGRVVALGHRNVIFRFNADGSPDTSFDGDGSRPAFEGGGISKEPNSVMVSASGKITVVGTGLPPACSFGFPCPTPDLRYFTVRYKQDGTPDTSFSDDGSLEIDVGGIVSAGYNGARTVAADSIGRVVVGGLSSSCCIRTYWETPRFSAMRIVAPPARLVSVSGRVTDANGNGVSGVTVSTSGLSARTSPFGFYTLDNVPTNQTYIFSVRSKTDLAFNKRTILVDDQISGLDFIGQQLDSARQTKK